jgi:hypothetical protein
MKDEFINELSTDRMQHVAAELWATMRYFCESESVGRTIGEWNQEQCVIPLES